MHFSEVIQQVFMSARKIAMCNTRRPDRYAGTGHPGSALLKSQEAIRKIRVYLFATKSHHIPLIWVIWVIWVIWHIQSPHNLWHTHHCCGFFKPGLPLNPRMGVFDQAVTAERCVKPAWTGPNYMALAQDYGTNDPQKWSCLLGKPSILIHWSFCAIATWPDLWNLKQMKTMVFLWFFLTKNANSSDECGVPNFRKPSQDGVL